MIDPSRGMPEHSALSVLGWVSGARSVEPPPSKELALTAIRAPRRLALQDFAERLCPFEPPLSAVGESVPLKRGDDRSICAHLTAEVGRVETWPGGNFGGSRTGFIGG